MNEEDIVIDLKKKTVALGEVTIDILNQRITVSGMLDSEVVDVNTRDWSNDIQTDQMFYDDPIQPFGDIGSTEDEEITFIPPPIVSASRTVRSGKLMEDAAERRKTWVGETVIVLKDEHLPLLNGSEWMVTKHINGALYRGTLVSCPPANGDEWNGKKASILLRHQHHESDWTLHHDRVMQEATVIEEEEPETWDRSKANWCDYKTCSKCGLSGVNKRTCESVLSSDKTWLQRHRVKRADGIWILYDGSAELEETI